MIKYKLIILSFLLYPFSVINAQKWHDLYDGQIPGAIPSQNQEQVYNEGTDNAAYAGVTQPKVQVFLPKHPDSSGAAIIIFPGGGYGGLAYGTEGIAIARAYNEIGIIAFIVKYRLPDDCCMVDKSTGPLQDAQQAMYWVRQHADKYHINKNKIGIIGYSAGGHLASTLGTHYQPALIKHTESISLRPDFMIVVYPVISMYDSLTHAGSKINLLGQNPSEAMVKLFSNEQQVTAETPPTYITHTGDDGIVSVNNSIVFYQALQKHGVHAELHLYAKGDHGFTQRLPIKEWRDPMVRWLKSIHILK